MNPKRRIYHLKLEASDHTYLQLKLLGSLVKPNSHVANIFSINQVYLIITNEILPGYVSIDIALPRLQLVRHCATIGFFKNLAEEISLIVVCAVEHENLKPLTANNKRGV